MSDDPAELAITDAISSFSIANHPPDSQQKPPPPGLRLNRDIVSRSTRSKDITTNFREAAVQLATGELIKDDFFTLFDAVGALEIMDPKMDSGYLEPGEALEDDYNIARLILPEELIAILDTLLGLQVAWLTGYPLSQTIFASVYVENILWPEPKTLDEASFRNRDGSKLSLTLCQSILRVYCLLLLKTCDFIYRRISEETYYEEEDFFTQLYNRTLLKGFPSDHILNLAEEMLGSISVDESIPRLQRDAISSRLNLQTSFLNATKGALESTPEATKIPWQRFSSHLPSIRDSHYLGVPVSSAISLKIQRRLASSVPPRPVVELNFTLAMDFLTRLGEDGVLVEDISNCSGLGSVVTFVAFFQAQYPQPTVYMRCHLQRLILRKFEYLGDSQASMLARHDLFDDLKRLVLPNQELVTLDHAANTPSPEIATRMLQFVTMVNEPFWAYIRALTMNRPRTRRMLCHTAIEWDAVQLELEDLDLDLRQFTLEKPLTGQREELWEFPLSSWAYDIKLRQLILIHQLGFELEIYHKDELSAAYWSLQWICSARHAHLERIMTFVKRKAVRLTKLTRSEADEFNTTILTVHYHIDYTIAIAALAEGLSSLYRALVLVDLLPKPQSAPYSTDSLRHALRTRPFTHIIHPPLPSAEEADSTREAFIHDLVLLARSAHHSPSRKSYPPQEEEALALLDHVDNVTKSARKAWDNVSKTRIDIARAEACESAWRTDIKNIQKSAIALGLASMGARRWVESGAKKGELEVSVGMGHDGGLYHVFWVVPTVKTVILPGTETGLGKQASKETAGNAKKVASRKRK